MAEWKLFDGEEADFSTFQFFRVHPWVPPEHQAGHAERTAMAAGLVRRSAYEHHPSSISDLGCGDGSLLHAISDLPVPMWGYDAGEQNLRVAKDRGVDARHADILSPGALILGEMVTCCEVLEHLADPHEFLRGITAPMIVASSPSAETAEWHYEHHAWAWNTNGYLALLEGTGWDVREHVECDGNVATHCGMTRRQRFQAIFATRRQ